MPGQARCIDRDAEQSGRGDEAVEVVHPPGRPPCRTAVEPAHWRVRDRRRSPVHGVRYSGSSVGVKATSAQPGRRVSGRNATFMADVFKGKRRGCVADFEDRLVAMLAELCSTEGIAVANADEGSLATWLTGPDQARDVIA